MANLPHVFGTLTVPPFPPLSYLDDNFNALNTAPSVSVVITGSPFNADPTGNTDSTAAIQAAINSLSVNGGMVIIPPGIFLVAGTLNITSGNIMIAGTGLRSSQLKFANGNANGIVIGGQATQIIGVTLKDLYLKGAGKTGGSIINASVISELMIERCDIDNAFNGIYLQQTNTVTISNCVLNVTVLGGSFAIKWFSPAINAQRSDGLSLYNVVVQCLYGGQDGFIWDGLCSTLRMFGCAFLGVHTGLHVLNSAASTTLYPAFLEAFDCEWDGCSNAAVYIEGGSVFHFNGCEISNTSGAGGQGSADIDTVTVLPDAAASVTRNVSFIGCRIGNTQRRALLFGARDLYCAGTLFSDASKAGSASYPVVELNQGTSCSDIIFSGCQLGVEFGNGIRSSYGLVIGASVLRVIAAGCSFYTNVTGAYQDNSGDPSIIISNAIDQNGAPLPNRFVQLAADPSAPVEGQFWENTTSHALKVYLNGAIKTVTVT